MKRRKLGKLLAALLSVIMLASLLPLSVLADNSIAVSEYTVNGNGTTTISGAAEAANGSVFVAAYDEDGRLLDVKTPTITSGAWAAVLNAAKEAIASIKAFLISTTGSVAPLTPNALKEVVLLVNGKGYDTLAAAQTAAGTLYPVEIVGNYTIQSGESVTIGANQTITVANGGSLTNLGTMNIQKGSEDKSFSGTGCLVIKLGGSYTGHGITVGSAASDSFQLLAEDDNGPAGYVELRGATGDVEGEYPAPFLITCGNVEVPANKTVTVTAENITTFSPDSLTVNGSLTSTAFNTLSGVVTVADGGSLTLNGNGQSASGPWYMNGVAGNAREPGGGVYVERGGSYTVNEKLMIGTSGAALNLTSGAAAIYGAPDDAGRDAAPFVFVSGVAEAGAYDWRNLQFIVETHKDAAGNETYALTIPSGVEVTLGSTEVRGTLTNNGTLNTKNTINVTGTLTNNDTLNNGDTIYVYGGASLTNTGTIHGTWQGGENDGWYDSAIVVDYAATGTQTSLTNSGTINDCVNVSCFVGDAGENDKEPDVSNTDTGAINTEIRYTAVVKTAAGLQRATGIARYDEYTPIGELTLTGNVTIPAGKTLYAPAGWYEGNGELDCSFTIASGATLTVNGCAQFWSNVTINGTVTVSDVQNALLIFGSGGENKKTVALNGALTNNGTLELQGNGDGKLNIAATGTLTNNGTLNSWGFLVTNNGAIANNGTVNMNYDFGSDDAGAMATGLAGAYTPGTGAEWNGTAYVRNGKGLSNAAQNNDISSIYTVTEEEVYTKTLTENVTIRAGVTLYVMTDYNESEEKTTPYELVVPSGKTLTVNGALVIGGTLTIDAGGIVEGTGTVLKKASGTINGNMSITPNKQVNVTTQEGLNTALGETDVSEIVLFDDGFTEKFKGYTISSFNCDRDLSITSEYGENDDWDNEETIALTVNGLTVNSGCSFSTSFVHVDYIGNTAVNGTLEQGPGSGYNTGTMTVKNGGKLDGGMSNFYNNAALTVESGGTIIIERGREFENSDGTETQAVLTINEGATMTVAFAGNHGAGSFRNTNGAELVNNGTITSYNWFDSYGGSINNTGIIDVYEGYGIGDQDLTNPGTINNYSIANLADLCRALVDVLDGRLDGLAQPEDDDYTGYSETYSDWGDFWNNDDDPGNDDNDGEYAVALMLKNEIIAPVGDRLHQYEAVSRTETKALLETLATKLGKTVTVTTAIMNPVDGDTTIGSGSIGERYNNVAATEYVPGTNELWNICEAFLAELGMPSSEDVTTEAALTAALEKSYVDEIHITQSMNITGGEEDGSDALCYYLTGIDNKDRVIYIDAGVTLTVGDGGTTPTKLDIESGVRLWINGHLTLSAGSGLNVFGELKPDNWGDEHSDLVTRGANTYINFFPDVMQFGYNLQETVGTRLDEPEVSDDTIALGLRGWPYGDGRQDSYKFLVAYAGETVVENGDNDYWDPYRKLAYGEAITMLTNVYKAVNDDATATLPESVKLDGYQSEWLINTDEWNLLLSRFAAALPRIADTTTTAYTIRRVSDGSENAENQPVISGVRFTQPITINCDPQYLGETDDWGGEIRFENCTFEQGVTIKYLSSVSFKVRFEDSCDLGTGKTVSVEPAADQALVGNRNVQIDGAKGLAITASAPTQVICGSGGSFTLNGVTVTGTGNTGENNYFNAFICYNCDGVHANDFDWRANDHSSCKMSDGSAAIISPELRLNTGAGGSITASNSVDSPLAMNVRVAGNADISGLTVAGNYAITVSDNNSLVAVNIGEKNVYIYEARGNGYTVSGSGKVHVCNSGADVTLQNGDNTVNYGAPHIFGNNGAYQIFVGSADADLVFTVEQNGTEYSFTKTAEDGKTHLSQNGVNAWIEPYNVRLTIAKTGYPTVVYEQVQHKTEVFVTEVTASYAGSTLTVSGSAEAYSIENYQNMPVTIYLSSDNGTNWVSAGTMTFGTFTHGGAQVNPDPGTYNAVKAVITYTDEGGSQHTVSCVSGCTEFTISSQQT